jgi:N-acetylneuraminic acid mutarotase
MSKAVFPVCMGILMSLAVVSTAAAQTPGEIITVAGNGTAGYSGDGGPATSAELFGPSGVAVDHSGNVYIADYEYNCVRKVTASTGIITTAAGICNQGGYSGDGGPATSASLFGPIFIALDGAGNLYIADAFNQRIRKVTASTGIITTVAGDGTQGFSGDGALAIYAQLNQPWGIGVDNAGNIYFADQNNNRIRKVTASTGVISTIAGTGTASYTGDGGPATSADLDFPSGIAVDASGNVYILVNGGTIIRKVTAATGIIDFYAGNGTYGFSGDEGPAASAVFNQADDLAVDGAGDLYIADTGNNRIRRVNAATHIITTVAGDGYIAPNTLSGGFSGDGGPATSAALNAPDGVVISGSGDMFISDSNNYRVREVFPGGLPGTATNLTVPASPAIYGTTMELTAQVTGTPGGPTPTGTVTFYDAGGIQIIVLGSAPLNSAGTASYFTKTLSAGYHNVYATYHGSASYGVSSSTQSTLNVQYAVAPAPTFYPPAGTYQSRVQVALWDSAGPTGIASLVSIFYTTDGSTPTPTHGTQYNGAITVNSSETIKAIAYAPALANNPSPVSTATYVINLPAESPLPTGEWVWESPLNTTGTSNPCGAYGIGSGGNMGTYGTLGVPAASNTPGSRQSAMNWTDKNDNLWLFGGFGFPATGTCASLNDLWMFNITTLEWTWMGGSSTDPNGYVSGVYGTLGQFAAGNMPGGRSGGVTWKDASGNLWLFGGSGNDSTGASGELNDVWEYNLTTHQWAWMAGSKFVNQRGYFAGFGVFHSGNTPGARSGAVGWTDNSGHFWLFGGYGYDAVSKEDYLSDLWEFNPSTRQWAWMGGSHYADTPGSYGTVGVPSVNTHPGGRSGEVGWVDKSGNFWLFGGYGYAAWGDTTYLNDMWEFNPGTLQWTWTTGYNGPGTAVGVYAIGQPGAYGTLSVPEPGNTPGSRVSPTSWTDKNGNLWLFGGVGFDVYGNGGNDGNFLNDLWEFVPATRLWAWMGGSNTTGLIASVYGQFRVPSAANFPSERWGSSTWTDKTGNLWLFGGEDDALENDLWKYQVP